MSERCLALDPSGAEPSVTMRMRGRVYGPAPLNRSQTYRSISQGGEWARGLTTLRFESTLELKLSFVAPIWWKGMEV
jgi:hypothetical protein